MSRSNRRDGLILAIVAAVTLIPGGGVVASQVGRLLSDEIEGFGWAFDPSNPPGGADGPIDAHLVVTFDQGLQAPNTDAVAHEFERASDAIIWGEDTVDCLAAPSAETVQPNASPTRMKAFADPLRSSSRCSLPRRQLTPASGAKVNLQTGAQ